MKSTWKILFLSAALPIAACGSDSDPLPEDNSNSGTDDDDTELLACTIEFQSADNNIRSASYYSFSEAGLLMRSEVDEGIDGEIETTIDHTYNDDGILVGMVLDRTDTETSPDTVWRYTVDAQGRQLKEEYDGDGDGDFDIINTSQFDDANNRVTYEQDSDGDGVTNSIFTETYDADDQLVLTESDYSPLGSINSRNLQTWENGRLVLSEGDSDNDGTIDNTYAYFYNADGNLIREDDDFDNDGTVDAIRAYEYDAAGNNIRVTFDNPIGGEFESEHTYTWDADGNMLSDESESGTTTFDYSCHS